MITHIVEGFRVVGSSRHSPSHARQLLVTMTVVTSKHICSQAHEAYNDDLIHLYIYLSCEIIG